MDKRPYSFAVWYILSSIDYVCQIMVGSLIQGQLQPKYWYSFCLAKWEIRLIIGQNEGIFRKYPKCRFFYTRYFHDCFIVVKATPQCFKSPFGSLKICNTGVKNDAFFNICEKKYFCGRSICPQKVPYVSDSPGEMTPAREIFPNSNHGVFLFHGRLQGRKMNQLFVTSLMKRNTWT